MIGLAERRRRWRLHENMIKDKHSEEQAGSIKKRQSAADIQLLSESQWDSLFSFTCEGETRLVAV